MRTPESYEKDEIKKYLESIGAWYCLTFTGGFGKSGNPDIVACINGTFWGIEVKREGKSLTVLQGRRIEAIIEAGGMAVGGPADKVIGHIKWWLDGK
jgi:Holliday junction resolvase